MIQSPRKFIFLPLCIFIAIFFLLYWSDFTLHPYSQSAGTQTQTSNSDFPDLPAANDEPLPITKHPVYKPITADFSPPVEDNFASVVGALGLPPIPRWNLPPDPHVIEPTPLFIGFSRNWLVLQQCVVSYIAAGWPPSDIYVVDNSGTMFSNQESALTIQNPSYIDYKRLTRTFGVIVLTTPTLLTFAQLQNYFLHHARQNEWPHYFWSHMDVVVLSNEAFEPYSSLYMRAVQALRETQAIANTPANDNKPWGTRFFRYDRLTLSNVASYTAVGGFDTFIPYYNTDCDFHFRLLMANYTLQDAAIGLVFDVGASLPDLRQLFHEDTAEALATCSADSDETKNYERNDCRYRALRKALEELEYDKHTREGGRNYWQGRQRGGRGEPFYNDAEGVEIAIKMATELGRRVYAEKWGHRDCDLKRQGLRPEDAWLVQHDW